MMMLKILGSEDERLVTDKGIFLTWEDCVISESTGEVFEVACSTTDENGDLCELVVE
ncbi:MAG: hypothetical protein LUE89_09295 [Clostridiales bacterium]|nr:hypothetical protein [Clostridiales bacterium]